MTLNKLFTAFQESCKRMLAFRSASDFALENPAITSRQSMSIRSKVCFRLPEDFFCQKFHAVAEWQTPVAHWQSACHL
jgi:hypothetical protein